MTVEMFDELVETKMSDDGKAAVKHLVADEQMHIACRALIFAERQFKKLDADPACVYNHEKNLRWWDALETMYCADKALWELFVGPDRSLRSNMQYAQFRSRILAGRPIRADA
jgi:hypothetical protein